MKLLAFLAAAFVPAAVGAPFAARGTYRALRRPEWAPPGNVFGPVWTILYVLIGVSGWLIASRSGGATPLRLWAAQLVLNAAWTPIFFGLRRPGLAMVNIVALLATAGATSVAAFRHRPIAGALLVPYVAWLAFATALNASIWRRNR
jgi:tryptophan-rich sensory protein